MTVGAGDPRKCRNANAVAGDQVANGVFVVKRRVNGCIRPCASKMREDALGAAALVEIVVYERNAQRGARYCALSRGSTSAIVGFPRYFRATRCKSASVVALIAPTVRFK